MLRLRTMSWKMFVCSYGLLAIAACGAATVTGTDSETDTQSPARDTSKPRPKGVPPTAAAPYDDDDAGRERSDAATHAADSGVVDGSHRSHSSQPSQLPEPAEPDTQTKPEPPPVVVPPLTISFEPPGGGFANPLQVTLQPADPNAQVHYTLDGTLPSDSSPIATAPIAITATTLVRAVAVRAAEAGGSPEHGAISNQAYFRLEADAREFRSDLPVVVIDLQGSTPPNSLLREYVSAVMGVFEPAEGVTQLEGSASLTSRIGIKVRGRSTRYQDKPSYSFELWGVAQEDAPAPLLGMPSDGDWVLYAPYTTDRSMLHNAFGYALSRRIERYAPRTQFCEVFLVNATAGVTQASYVGIYVLTERIGRGAERVPVRKLDPEDITEPKITGGYIFQANEPDVPDEGFDAAGTRYLYVHPNQDDAQPAQTQYITGYIEGVMRAVSAADGRDPLTAQHYSELIDVPAFIDHHILNVLVKNPDAFGLSSYFHKDRGGPLAAGPLWDLDLAMAGDDAWGQRTLDPTQWNPTGEDLFSRAFWGPLFMHADFEEAYWQRWRELLAGPFAASELQALVDELAHQVMQAEPRNRARWPESATRYESYEAEVDALRAWLAARVDWIAANVGVLPAQ